MKYVCQRRLKLLNIKYIFGFLSSRQNLYKIITINKGQYVKMFEKIQIFQKNEDKVTVIDNWTLDLLITKRMR